MAQLLFGTLFGALGLFLATPIALCLAMLVQTLYVEDKIEKEDNDGTAKTEKAETDD